MAFQSYESTERGAKCTCLCGSIAAVYVFACRILPSFAGSGVEWVILQNDTGSGRAYCNYLQLRMLVNVGAIRKSNAFLSIAFVK